MTSERGGLKEKMRLAERGNNNNENEAEQETCLLNCRHMDENVFLCDRGGVYKDKYKDQRV